MLYTLLWPKWTQYYSLFFLGQRPDCQVVGQSDWQHLVLLLWKLAHSAAQSTTFWRSEQREARESDTVTLVFI